MLLFPAAEFVRLSSVSLDICCKHACAFHVLGGLYLTSVWVSGEVNFTM